MTEEKTPKLVIDLEDLRQGLTKHKSLFRKTIASYREKGFEIVMNAPVSLTSNGNGSLSESMKELLDLASFCDAIVFSGPNQGINALHLDDRAVTSAEFINLSQEEINLLMERR